MEERRSRSCPDITCFPPYDIVMLLVNYDPIINVLYRCLIINQLESHLFFLTINVAHHRKFGFLPLIQINK